MIMFNSGILNVLANIVYRCLCNWYIVIAMRYELCIEFRV